MSSIMFEIVITVFFKDIEVFPNLYLSLTVNKYIKTFLIFALFKWFAIKILDNKL